jgi:preprotein translocase subunit YajC
MHLNSLLTLLAQTDNQQGGPPLASYLMFGLPLLLLLMFWRTSSKQKREQQNALAGLKKNDKVVTQAGILGVVVAIKENEDEVTLRVDDTSNTRIRVLKSSIVRINSGDAPAGDAK